MVLEKSTLASGGWTLQFFFRFAASGTKKKNVQHAAEFIGVRLTSKVTVSVVFFHRYSGPVNPTFPSHVPTNIKPFNRYLLFVKPIAKLTN